MQPTSFDSTGRPRCLSFTAASFGNLVLSSPDAHQFLRGLTGIAASLVAGSDCSITVRHDQDLTSVASNDAIPMRGDVIDFLHGPGPGLEALRTAARVDVPNTAQEHRWEHYRERAAAHQIRCSVSLPLAVEGEALGALTLFASKPYAFSEEEISRAEEFANQAATVLSVLFRHTHQVILDEDLRTTLASRSVIDQALGILMYTQQFSSRQAFEVLRSASQSKNRKVSAIASDLIETMTGHPPEPPRPLAQRAPGPQRSRPASAAPTPKS